jgi:protoheme IX farnesyltransferase
LVLAARVGTSCTTEPSEMGAEKHLFAYSVFYLFALFAVLVADRWLA